MTDPTIRVRCVCTCGHTWRTADLTNTTCPRPHRWPRWLNRRRKDKP